MKENNNMNFLKTLLTLLKAKPIEQAFIAAYEIDSARNAREGLAEKHKWNKERKSK